MTILFVLSLIISVAVIIYYVRKEKKEENESYLLGYQSSTRQIAETGSAVPYITPTDAFEAGWNHGIDKTNESIEKAVED